MCSGIVAARSATVLAAAGPVRRYIADTSDDGVASSKLRRQHESSSAPKLSSADVDSEFGSFAFHHTGANWGLGLDEMLHEIGIKRPGAHAALGPDHEALCVLKHCGA